MYDEGIISRLYVYGPEDREVTCWVKYGMQSHGKLSEGVAVSTLKVGSFSGHVLICIIPFPSSKTPLGSLKQFVTLSVIGKTRRFFTM